MNNTKTQIKINGIELNVPEAEAVRLVKEYGERPKQGVVTPWQLIRPSKRVVSISEIHGKICLSPGNDMPIYLDEVQTLELARALTVAALEKLGVAAPSRSRASAHFRSFAEDGGNALSWLDDLIQGAEQEAGV